MSDTHPRFPPLAPARGPLRVLFSCVGRRVELILAFRKAAERLGRRLEAWGSDRSWLAPGMHCVDRPILTPAIASPEYIPFLLRLVQRHSIQLCVPLIDSDLMKLAAARAGFAAAGCAVAISSPTVVATCRDKLLTYHHLLKNGIDTPRTWSLDEAARLGRRHYPIYLKPRAGSAARGHFIAEDRSALRALAHNVVDPIAQEYVRGDEYTLDAYAGFDGTPRCVVPRLRLEVRSGEVSKGRVVKNRDIMAVGRRVVESLGACVGVVTIQCIQSAGGRIRVIEINPRIGGGAPLAIEAGADIPYWMLAGISGKTVRIRPDGFRDGLCMLRYDRSVFLDRAAAEQGKSARSH